MKRFNVKPDNVGRLDELSEAADKFVGAELADLVIKATRRAHLTKSPKIDTAWMLERVAQTTPIAAQDAFAAELEANRRACDQFTIIGRTAATDKRSPLMKTPAGAPAGRAERV